MYIDSSLPPLRTSPFPTPLQPPMPVRSSLWSSQGNTHSGSVYFGNGADLVSVPLHIQGRNAASVRTEDCRNPDSTSLLQSLTAGHTAPWSLCTFLPRCQGNSWPYLRRPAKCQWRHTYVRHSWGRAVTLGPYTGNCTIPTYLSPVSTAHMCMEFRLG